MKELLKKSIRLTRRKSRVRGKIFGTSSVPRLSVSKSNLSLYCQIIDDSKQSTLVGVSSKSLTKGKSVNLESAFELGKLIGTKALESNIKRVVFDRGGRKYTGRVSAVAEGAREVGLKI